MALAATLSHALYVMIGIALCNCLYWSERVMFIMGSEKETPFAYSNANSNSNATITTTTITTTTTTSSMHRFSQQQQLQHKDDSSALSSSSSSSSAVSCAMQHTRPYHAKPCTMFQNCTLDDIALVPTIPEACQFQPLKLSMTRKRLILVGDSVTRQMFSMIVTLWTQQQQQEQDRTNGNITARIRKLQQQQQSSSSSQEGYHKQNNNNNNNHNDQNHTTSRPIVRSQVVRPKNIPAPLDCRHFFWTGVRLEDAVAHPDKYGMVRTVCIVETGRYNGRERIPRNARTNRIKKSACAAKKTVKDFYNTNVGDTMECLTARKLIRSGDIVVVNTGLHHPNSTTLVENVETFITWSKGKAMTMNNHTTTTTTIMTTTTKDKQNEPIQQQPSSTTSNTNDLNLCIAWYQTLPQHFPTATGSYETGHLHSAAQDAIQAAQRRNGSCCAPLPPLPTAKTTTTTSSSSSSWWSTKTVLVNERHNDTNTSKEEEEEEKERMIQFHPHQHHNAISDPLIMASSDTIHHIPLYETMAPLWRYHADCSTTTTFNTASSLSAAAAAAASSGGSNSIFKKSTVDCTHWTPPATQLMTQLLLDQLKTKCNLS